MSQINGGGFSGEIIGTITQVGDVTSGAAFSGTQGTILTSTSAGFTLKSGNALIGNGSDFNLIGSNGLSFGLSSGGAVNITAGNGGELGGSGGALTLTSGSANSLSANSSAGQVLIQTGTDTGSGAIPPLIRINGNAYGAGGSGTVQAGADRIVSNIANPVLTNNVAHTVLQFTMGSPLPLASGYFLYSVEARDNANQDFQVCSGQINFVASFILDTVSIQGSVSQIGTETSSCSTGTLSTTWSFIDSGLVGSIQVTPNSSLGTIDTLVVYGTMVSNSQGHIAVLTS